MLLLSHLWLPTLGKKHLLGTQCSALHHHLFLLPFPWFTHLKVPELPNFQVFAQTSQALFLIFLFPFPETPFIRPSTSLPPNTHSFFFLYFIQVSVQFLPMQIDPPWPSFITYLPLTHHFPPCSLCHIICFIIDIILGHIIPLFTYWVSPFSNIEASWVQRFAYFPQALLHGRCSINTHRMNECLKRVPGKGEQQVFQKA